MQQTNIHATALVLGGHGLLIAGPSGSGKSNLALMLISTCEARGGFARLVGDDQLFVAARSGRLVVTCPRQTAGLVEVHGLGPRALPHMDAAVIDLVVRLVAEDTAPRFAEPASETIAGLEIPCLDLPARNAQAASLALNAWLAAPPFRRAAEG